MANPTSQRRVLVKVFPNILNTVAVGHMVVESQQKNREKTHITIY